MANVQINYTHKLPQHYDPHTRIQGVAGDGGGGWYRTENQVLDDLRTGQNSYYVQIGGHRVSVVRAIHLGHPYIKTVTDGYSPDNLVALPEPPRPLIP
jgi:hypothetical protein